MAFLIFDGAKHNLTLLDSKAGQMGQWPANNIVDHRATLRFVPNRVHALIDRAHPHKHSGGVDTTNGTYGPAGIIRLHPFSADGTTHSGVGVHSGRKSQGGHNHPTMGCIRTTDEAMTVIAHHMLTDQLTHILVFNNHLQQKVHRHARADSHQRLVRA